MMKKITALLVVVLLLCIPTTVFAAEEATTYLFVNRGSLSIENTTATCTAFVQADSSDTHVVMKLWHGNSCIGTWIDSNKSLILLNETVSVRKGETYTLTIDTTIDGKALPRFSQTKKC